MTLRATSRMANRNRNKGAAAFNRTAIVNCLMIRGPMTRESLGQTLRIKSDSLRPRIVELLRARSIYVRDTNGRTVCGNKAERLAVYK